MEPETIVSKVLCLYLGLILQYKSRQRPQDAGRSRSQYRSGKVQQPGGRVLFIYSSIVDVMAESILQSSNLVVFQNLSSMEPSSTLSKVN